MIWLLKTRFPGNVFTEVSLHKYVDLLVLDETALESQYTRDTLSRFINKTLKMAFEIIRRKFSVDFMVGGEDVYETGGHICAKE